MKLREFLPSLPEFVCKWQMESSSAMKTLEGETVVRSLIQVLEGSPADLKVDIRANNMNFDKWDL